MEMVFAGAAAGEASNADALERVWEAACTQAWRLRAQGCVGVGIPNGPPQFFLNENSSLHLASPIMLLRNGIGAGGLTSSFLAGKQAGEEFQRGHPVSPKGSREAQVLRLPLPH